MILKKGVILFPLLMLATLLSAQEVPFYPISYRLFSPAIFNPAITGSHDFSQISFITNLTRSHPGQTLNGDVRLPVSNKQKRPEPDALVFSNFGVGGYFFHEAINSYNYSGLAVSGSYHIPITRDHLSFFSVGITGKGIYSVGRPGTDQGDTTKNNVFKPDMDLGVYFYSAHFFAGVSATSLFSNPNSSSFPSQLTGILSRQFFLNTGYKIVLSNRRSLVLEPSLMMDFGNSFSDTASLHYHPALTLYYKHSSIGFYLNDPDDLSFFLHVQTPWFYVGSYVEYPWNMDIPWKNSKLTIELLVGITIGKKTTASHYFKYWE